MHNTATVSILSIGIAVGIATIAYGSAAQRHWLAGVLAIIALGLPAAMAWHRQRQDAELLERLLSEREAIEQQTLHSVATAAMTQCRRDTPEFDPEALDLLSSDTLVQGLPDDHHRS